MVRILFPALITGVVDENWRIIVPPHYLDIGSFPADGDPNGLDWTS
jgi:hypothetical protein